MAKTKASLDSLPRHSWVQITFSHNHQGPRVFLGLHSSKAASPQHRWVAQESLGVPMGSALGGGGGMFIT